MKGSLLALVLLGAFSTAIIFAIIYACTKVREHGQALTGSLLLGILVLATPLRPLLWSTAGSLAGSLASWLWTAGYLVGWIIGSVIGFMLLKSRFP